MPRNFLSRLDYSRHARWLQRITGSDHALAVCDAAGVPCWTAPGHADLEHWLLHLDPEGFAWQADGEGMQRHDAPDATLLYQPVVAKGRRLGWLAVRVARVDGLDNSTSGNAAPFAWDALAEALEDIAATIGDEYATHGELNAMADELSDRYEELHLVYAIDRQVQDMTSGEDVFGDLLESWAEHMNADVAAFIKPGDNLCVSATNLSAPIHNLDLVLVEMRGDLYRFTHSSRQPIVMNAADDPRRAYIFTDMPFKILCCPVFQDKSVVAILVLLNHADKADFTNSDRKLGEVLANHLSSLSRMHSMLAETSKFNEQMAAALIEAVEAKDPYTRGHSERVHHISMEIGRALRLPPRELDNLFWGSLLHDVGKIGIPDAVLCKPGRLTRDEFTFIMVHPERSYEILRHIDRLKGAVPGARHHQEKYDGTGYPHGLEGNDIPYNARIIAVADTYDSITSSRAYRAGRSHEVAMAEIVRVAGAQLDPGVIDAFVGVCRAEPAWIAAFGIARDGAAESFRVRRGMTQQAAGGDSITRSRIGAMTYLAPVTALVADEAVRALQAALNECIGQHQVSIVVDLGKVPQLSGRALGMMAEMAERLAALGGWLRLAYPNALLQEILLATGLQEQLPLFDTRAAPARRPREAGSKLGDILVERGAATAEQVAEAARLQEQTGKRMGLIMVERKWISEAALYGALADQLNLPYVNLRAGLYDPPALALLDKDVARRLNVLPLFQVRDTLTVASAEPQAIHNIDELRTRTGCRIRIVIVPPAEIRRVADDAYGGTLPEFVHSEASDLELIESTIPDDYTQIDEMAGASPVINMVNAVIQRAIRDSASDIHIEISRNRARIRLRIDGILYEVMSPKVEQHPAIVSRLKVMANLDIAERRLPQDGRIQVATQGRTVDLRFSSLPGIYGEKVVLRVLDKNQSILDVDKLGMNDTAVSSFKRLLGRSHGLILVTGPTGSGKTTSLYAAISHLKSIEKNIVTIEDPVEYQLDIINQNQVNDAIGLTFPKILKHVLRQDPDIIMIGEIRDRQTAEIAVQAALTGHLVLTTLHTNDTLGAVSRLVEMGVEPYLLASALIGVMAQRLVRRVCQGCRTSYLATPEAAAAYRWRGKGDLRLMRGRGCPACYDSGYKGRMGIYELLEVGNDLQRMIVANASKDQLAAHVNATGHHDLYADGMTRAFDGHTTPEEIARVVHSL